MKTITDLTIENSVLREQLKKQEERTALLEKQKTYLIGFSNRLLLKFKNTK
ncbi:hypothetical protein [Emticicia soli]|uniref:Transposase n=1 Tax=Emticicia soli TaxID=2027878 RepID=A0ABW5J9J8_9BACT